MMWRHLKRLPLLRNPATRRRLKQLPVIRHVKQAWWKTRRSYDPHFGHYWLAKKVAATPRKRIVIGAWSRFDPGWIPTQREFLNLTEPRDFERCFEPNSVEAMLAEHVWEHITPAEGLAAARTCFKYRSPADISGWLCRTDSCRTPPTSSWSRLALRRRGRDPMATR